MGLLRALGLGKDAHVEWMIEALGAKPGEVVVNRQYAESPEYQCWRGELQGVPATIYTQAGNKHRGGAVVYLGTAGPAFLEGVGDYRCFFYRPRAAPSLTIDDPRWARAAAEAMGHEEWSSSFPEEAFELGVGVGRFALELDGPLDPRPVFPHLPALRKLLEPMCDAVDSVYLYPAGVALCFDAKQLTRDKLLAELRRALDILRISSSIG